MNEPLQGQAMTNKRECGKCSLCCKLLPIQELSKPIDTWCPHCRPGHGGCTIYSSRPSECRGFSCLWLSNPFEFGDEWFPARSKMVLATPNEKQLLVLVDPDFPNAWRREPYYSKLLKFAHLGNFVGMRIGLRCIELRSDGSEREVHHSQAHIEGRERDVFT